MQRTNADTIEYGQGLIAVLQGLEVIEAKGSRFERMLTRILRPMYRRRLRSIVASAPPEITNEIFSVIGEASTQ